MAKYLTIDLVPYRFVRSRKTGIATVYDCGGSILGNLRQGKAQMGDNWYTVYFENGNLEIHSNHVWDGMIYKPLPPVKLDDLVDWVSSRYYAIKEIGNEALERE